MAGETDELTTIETDTEVDDWQRHTKRRRVLGVVALVVGGGLFAYSWQQMDVNYGFILSSPTEFISLFRRMWPPNVGYASEIVGPLVETVHIAVLGTIGALIIAGPVALLSARNTTLNRGTYFLGKLLIASSRSINTIIWALIFVVIFGPGMLAGVVAISVRSVGFCAKLLAEEIEEIDFGQVEAATAVGAGSTKTLIYAIVPQIKPTFIGISTFRWDINVRASTILGFVGAGGIGFELQSQVNSFAWHSVFTILIAILLVVILSELVSAWARAKAR
jgi:phosphonate transport system permease protein